MKLNQVLALEKQAKTKAFDVLKEALKLLKKEDLYTGHLRTYTPFDPEDRDRVPDSVKRVQVRADEKIREAIAVLAPALDASAQKEWTNCRAVADVVVGGTVLLKDVPVTYLLHLEKQLIDIHDLVKDLPRLSLDREWHYDANAGYYTSDMERGIRTKKTLQSKEVSKATVQHPAQVQTWTEDVPIGEYVTRNFSAALPADRVGTLLTRVETLQAAVKTAREAANMTTVVEVPSVGEAVLGYLFAE